MHTKKLLVAFAIGLGLTLALLCSLDATLAVAAPAADLVVTKLIDSADGACDSDCSLREAIIAANNNAGADVISLPLVGTYELTVPGTGESHAATGDLDIRDDLTIIGQGPGATIIDANGIDRVFSLLNASTVVISGVKIMGGALPNGIGGGISNVSTDLTLINVAVVSNTSTSGGAIRLDGADAILTLGEDCLLARNEADYGGGISIVSGAQALLNDGRIVSNTASWYGGGVYAAQGSVTMSGVQIISNTSNLLGGGVYLSNSTLTLNGGAILSNTAETSGGGVHVSAGVFTQTGESVIAHNTANERGGGIHVSHGTAILNGGRIAHNRVTGAGGNSYGGGGVYVGAGTATLIQTGSSTIVENSAAMHGGGMIVEWGRVTLSGGQILSNTAGKNGGGIYLYSSATLTQTGGLIAYNDAQGTDTYDGGGGIYSNGTTNSVRLSGGQIMENQANHGGGLHVQVGSLDLLGAEIVGNHATLYGGGVYAGSMGRSVLLEGGRIISNSAEYGGGLYVTKGSVTLERGQVVDNHANSEGGGVYHDTDGGSYHMLTLVNTTISGNSAPDGSALVNASGTTVLTYTTIASNTTDSAGYGIQKGTGSILANNTIIAYNDHDNCASGAVTSNNHNLDSDGTCGFGGTFDQQVDPELAPLAYDLGTLVHAIAPGSPAHDAGDCQAGITTDQRGAPRVAPCDVGAYEYGEIYILTVAKDGTGVGTVDPSVGAHIYLSGTVVPITASAGLHSTFEGWSGDLGGETNPTSITMDGHRVVTATFTLITYPLDVDVAGDGTVSSTPAGIDCGADCSEMFVEGTVVTLTAVPSTGSIFDDWSGAGCGGADDCVVTMDAAKQVTATFVIPDHVYLPLVMQNN